MSPCYPLPPQWGGVGASKEWGGRHNYTNSVAKRAYCQVAGFFQKIIANCPKAVRIYNRAWVTTEIAAVVVNE